MNPVAVYSGHGVTQVNFEFCTVIVTDNGAILVEYDEADNCMEVHILWSTRS